MKMMSSTSMTSARGVTLMLALTSLLPRPAIPMTVYSLVGGGMAGDAVQPEWPAGPARKAGVDAGGWLRVVLTEKTDRFRSFLSGSE